MPWGIGNRRNPRILSPKADMELARIRKLVSLVEGFLPLITLITLIFLDQDHSLFKTKLQNHNLFIISEICAICGKYFGFRD